jgi:hypothetical protein
MAGRRGPYNNENVKPTRDQPAIRERIDKEGPATPGRKEGSKTGPYTTKTDKTKE